MPLTVILRMEIFRRSEIWIDKSLKERIFPANSPPYKRTLWYNQKKQLFVWNKFLKG